MAGVEADVISPSELPSSQRKLADDSQGFQPPVRRGALTLLGRARAETASKAQRPRSARKGGLGPRFQCQTKTHAPMTHQHITFSIEKNEETRQWLVEALAHLFGPDEKGNRALQIAVDACAERHVAKDEVLAEQGSLIGMYDPQVFVLERGELSVYRSEELTLASAFRRSGKRFSSRGDVIVEPVSADGSDRRWASSVVSDCSSLLWCIDRATFLAATREHWEWRQRRISSLRNFMNLSESRTPHGLRARWVEANNPVRFQKDDTIIDQSGLGVIYMLVEGSAVVLRDGKAAEHISDLGFLGDLESCADQPKPYRAYAATACACVRLDIDSFKELARCRGHPQRQQSEWSWSWVRQWLSRKRQ